MQSYVLWALLGMAGYSLMTLFVKLAERSGSASSYMVLAVATTIVPIFALAMVAMRGEFKALFFEREQPPLRWAIAAGLVLTRPSVELLHGPRPLVRMSGLARISEGRASVFEATAIAHRFVADDDRTVLGWVAVSTVSSRCAYAGVVEHSVYVDPAAQGRGIGLALLHALISSTEAAGIWTIQSGVFPENTASMRLHEKAGFRVIGLRHHIGRVQRPGGNWRDVALVERRSPTVYPA